jgi:hypothetical protein
MFSSTRLLLCGLVTIASGAGERATSGAASSSQSPTSPARPRAPVPATTLTPDLRAELSARTIGTFSRELSARRRTTPHVPEKLRWVSERPMIIRMMTRSGSQRRYDHRLRDLVQRTGDLTIATDLGVPRSTAELSPRTFCTRLRELSSYGPDGRQRRRCRLFLAELKGVSAPADDRLHAEHGPPAATV